MDPSAEPWEDHRVPSADEQICLMVTASHRLVVCNAPDFYSDRNEDVDSWRNISVNLMIQSSWSGLVSCTLQIGIALL